MRLRIPIALLVLAAVVATACAPRQTVPATARPTAPPDAAGPGWHPTGVDHVRVTARILVVDHDAASRAGLDYVLIGNGDVRVTAAPRGGLRDSRGVRIGVGTHGVTAFLDAVRESRWVRSESTQQVLTISGGEALVSSTSVAVGRGASRTQGPSLLVRPTVLEDGSVHLQVSARVEDSVTYAWGYGVDGSPAAVDTELIARPGHEVILASSSSVQTTRDSGILRWGATEQGREVLVVMRAEVVR